jgi:alkanesulfonate monooxygenase SsuD/methylene tetrahydromethanopterin reductase-like flavin-dependent oxidoreductase (luciferase family)
MTELGLQGFGDPPVGVGELEHYRIVLESLPHQFTTVWISDHFQYAGEPYLEAWTVMTYLATAYPRFRYGNMVIGQSYRNPALLAKMAQTLQFVTGGRCILGIGAGWLEEEYQAYGYEYPPAGVRVDQLAEAIQVIRAVWAQSEFEGRHYRTKGALCEAPDPPIPIMVGTNGPKALAVTARHADWWNWDGPWEPIYRVPYERLRQHCDAIGRDFTEIVLTAGLTIEIPDDPSTFEPSYTHEFYPGQVFPIVGPTPTDVAREIERLVDVGVKHLALAFIGGTRTRERFIAEVLPNVRLDQA